MQEYSAIGATAVAVAVLIQLLKKMPAVKWMNDHSEAVNRTVGILAACATGLGIHFTYDPNVGGSILLPSVPELFQGIGHVLSQWGVQQTFYKVAFGGNVDERLVAQIAAALKGNHS